MASLLGEGELRELISPEVVAMVELELQRLTGDWQVQSSDQLLDLLRDLGPLSIDEIALRTGGSDASGLVEELRVRRVVAVAQIGGRECVFALEDTARLRDGLGVPPPVGIPEVFLQPVPDPLGDLVGRYARTHGPFPTATVAAALGLPPAVVEATLTRLAQAGRVLSGVFHQGEGWVDAEVLRRLKRRSLAVLRQEIEPSPPSQLAPFLVSWQRLSEKPRSRLDLMNESIGLLQGYEVAASILESEILGSRVAEPAPLLDRLLMAGEVVWAGRGTLGGRDGKVSLYRRSDFANLWKSIDSELDLDAVHQAILDTLAARGASFFYDIYQGLGGVPDEVLDHLWDLVWTGRVTNDSVAPLRAYVQSKGGRRPPGRMLPSNFPAHASGRWSLLPQPEPEPTLAATTWVDVLLNRYGILTRSHVAAESIPGGFTRLYPVLTRLEEVGKVRRGYFIEGLGGAQFALPGAVDRLRNTASSGVIGLAATDPANPYGAILPLARRRSSVPTLRQLSCDPW